MFIIPAAENAAWKTPQVFQMFTHVSGTTRSASLAPQIENQSFDLSFTAPYPAAADLEFVSTRFAIITIAYKRGSTNNLNISVTCNGQIMTRVLHQTNNSVCTAVFYMNLSVALIGGVEDLYANRKLNFTILKQLAGNGTAITGWLFDNMGTINHIGSASTAGDSLTPTSFTYSKPTCQVLAVLAQTKKTSGFDVSFLYGTTPSPTNDAHKLFTLERSQLRRTGISKTFKSLDAWRGVGVPESSMYDPYAVGASVGDISLISGVSIFPIDQIYFYGHGEDSTFVGSNVLWSNTGSLGASCACLFELIS